MPQTLPAAAYVHVPFCGRRCGYCNFTLVTGRDDLIDAYLDALELELAQQLGQPRSVKTLFLGGGTPSYLSGPQMQRLQEMLGKWLPLEPGGEYSCEANPLDCTAEQLDLLRASGVNRISLGGQSLSDRKLQVLERDHQSNDLVSAVHRCAERFPSVSLDLIFAAPGENLEQWQADLSRALELPIQHFSAYGLTVERGSAFYGRVQKQQLTEVDEDTQLEMYRAGQAAAASKGFEQYEVSNYALPGHRCRHNETYWLGQPWWAVGPGAASYLPESLIAESRVSCFDDSRSLSGSKHLPAMHRRVNHRSTTTYIRRMQQGQSPVQETEVVSPIEQLRERVVFGLRRLEGVDILKLQQWWGDEVLSHFQPAIDRFVDQGWLSWNGSTLQLTQSGLVISDSLWSDLFGHQTA